MFAMYRVRIKKPPTMAQGGEAGGVRSFIPQVDRSRANIEAERGEFVMGDFDQDSVLESYRIGGERHGQGGTPLEVPGGSFVFSDTRRLRLGGPILESFGKNGAGKKKYTPAQLAKQYDMNTYKALLNDPNSDEMDKETARLAMKHNQEKLMQLAMVQESMKGFPQGIPSIAMPLVARQQGMSSEAYGPGDDMPMMSQDGLVQAQDGRWVQPLQNGLVDNRPWPMRVAPSFPSSSVNTGFYTQPLGNGMVDNRPWPARGMGAPGPAVDPSFYTQPFGSGMVDNRPWPARGTSGPPVDPTRFVQPFGSGMVDTRAWPNRTIPPPVVVDPTSFVQPFGNNAFGATAPVQTAPVQTASAETTDVPSKKKTTGQPVRDDGRTRSLYGEDTLFMPGGYGTDVVMPGYIKGLYTDVTVPEVQHRRSAGTYGTQDWDMNDFYSRHPWVKDLKPGFDPKKTDDVQWFQNEYNNRYRKVWRRDYFDGKDAHRKIDSKFGQYTYSTPSIVPGEDPPPPTDDPQPGTTPAGKTTEVKKDDQKKDEQKNTPAVASDPFRYYDYLKLRQPWYPQDKINVGSAAINLNNIRKYAPLYHGLSGVLPNVTFEDPGRELAANQQQMNAFLLNQALTGNAQLARSIGLAGYGQAANVAADRIAGVGNRNVNTDNQNEQMQASILNNIGNLNANAKDLYRQRWATLNQQYDIARAQGRDQLRDATTNALTNANNLALTNYTNEQYGYHPDGTIYFKGGRPLTASGAPGTSSTNDADLYNQYYNEFKKANTGIDKLDEKANEYAMKKIQNRQNITVNNAGQQQYSVSGYGINPTAYGYPLNAALYKYMGMPAGSGSGRKRR
jgi:hypothetical protein